jgi:hypothetical protein
MVHRQRLYLPAEDAEGSGWRQAEPFDIVSGPALSIDKVGLAMR